jgi:hypothetical protein
MAHLRPFKPPSSVSAGARGAPSAARGAACGQRTLGARRSSLVLGRLQPASAVAAAEETAKPAATVLLKPHGAAARRSSEEACRKQQPQQQPPPLQQPQQRPRPQRAAAAGSKRHAASVASSSPAPAATRRRRTKRPPQRLLDDIGAEAVVAMDQRRVVELLGARARLRAVPESGDCLYEGLITAFHASGEPLPADLRVSEQHGGCPVTALRWAAAEAVDEQTFDQFALYGASGLPDYAFMEGVESAAMLREMMRRTGREVGRDECIWANEFEIRVLSRTLATDILILDFKSAGGENFLRFACGGSEDSAWQIVLQRTGDNHYNLVLVSGRGRMSRDQLPDAVVSLWSL